MQRRLLALLVGLGALTVATRAQRPAVSSVAATEWRHYGGDAASSKYSSLAQISATNVGRLGVAWRWSTPDNDIVKANPARPYGYQDTPLMVNGVLYTTTPLGIVAAIDPVTGRTLWSYDPRSWTNGRPTNLGFTHRGSAYWTDGTRKRIITGTHDAQLISIDAETGRPDADFGTAGRVSVADGLPYVEPLKNYAMNSSPVVVRNGIIGGANSADRPRRKEQHGGGILGLNNLAFAPLIRSAFVALKNDGASCAVDAHNVIPGNPHDEGVAIHGEGGAKMVAMIRVLREDFFHQPPLVTAALIAVKDIHCARI